MQLDRVPLSPRNLLESVTPPAPSGVEELAGGAVITTRRPPLTWRGVLLVAAGALSLFGQGERYRIDPRLVSPMRTIASYWEALRHDDEIAAAQCMVEGQHDLPYPGMLWFLPPTSELRLGDFRSVPTAGGHVLVTYIVRYRPTGSPAEEAFVTGCELARQRGEWRIVRPIGEASMPDWKPTSRTVDI